MQAAMGSVQLAKLERILSRKTENANWMEERLANVDGVQVPARLPDRSHPYMLYTLSAPSKRDAIMTALLEAGIESKVYFPPAHLQPIFGGTDGDRLPATEEAAERILSIPFHSRLGSRELEEIAATIEGASGRRVE